MDTANNEASINAGCQEELDESDLDDFIGPVLLPFSTTTTSTSGQPVGDKPVSNTEQTKQDRGPTLQQLHEKRQQEMGSKDKHKLTKFDHAKGLNDEVKQELLRKLNADGGLSSRFTSTSNK